MQLRDLFRNVGQRLFNSNRQPLDQAYEAALAIKKLEDDYFDGRPITPNNSNYGSSAYVYLQGEVSRNLSLIRQ